MPPATSNRSANYGLALQSGRARARKRIGDETEDLVEQLCKAAAHVAMLRRRYTPQKQLPNGRVVYLEKQGPDVCGYLRGGRVARHIEAEVKRCSGRRFELRRVQADQREALSEARAAGAIAVLLVVYGPVLLTASICAVPWGICEAAIAAGTASLGPDELLTWCVPRKIPWILAPWVHRDENDETKTTTEEPSKP